MPVNPLLDELQRRTLIAQITSEELHDHLSNDCRTLYAGFDPTADSLHIGHLVPLLLLRRFQLAGHRPLALVGGATGLIGDPSFKAAERQLNSRETVEEWVACLQRQIEKFLDFDSGKTSALVVNNADWTQNVDVLTFLRDVGKHFSVNAMVQKESVKQRIEREGSGISFTEFTYMILQSYDFAVLSHQYNCSLQIGGSDQWGNITGGIDLARRLYQKSVYGLTVPLVTKADGTKFGKTESGTVWLDPQKTSPYAFYQFWINTADADVYTFLRYFTFLNVTEIDEIERQDQASDAKPQAQSILANEVTRFIHSEAGLTSAQRISTALFSGDLQQLSETDLAQLQLDGMPSSPITDHQIDLVDALVQATLAKSKTQAREFIKSNAVSVNGIKYTDLEAKLSRDQAFYQRYLIIKRGKKLFYLLHFV